MLSLKLPGFLLRSWCCRQDAATTCMHTHARLLPLLRMAPAAAPAAAYCCCVLLLLLLPLLRIAAAPAPAVTHGSCCCSCCYVLLLLPLLQLPHPCRFDSHPHLASQCHSLMTHNTTCTDSPSGPRPGKQLPAVSHPAAASQGGGGGVTGPA
jgi:hypothetical protein